MRKSRGFTLIELLIVIAIVGALAAAFLPDLLNAKEGANDAATTARLTQLQAHCEKFQQKHHYYPPDDLQDPEGKLQFKSDNGTNTGIESLVAFLSQSQSDGQDLSSFGNHLTNTDSDDNGAKLPLLGKSQRLEVADEWDTPLAYFSKTSTNGGFAKAQSIAVGPDLPPILANARKNAEGTPLGARAFQLLSAGRDRIFGTPDDISYPDQ
jgi:prepilin-type N-terminal cleavage/methylation domain-containing protein